MKLPKAIQLACAIYYINRAKMYKTENLHRNGQDHYLTIRTPYKWDKEADWEGICAACEKHKIGISSIAGTFWFKFPNIKKTYELDDRSFPIIKAT